MSYTGSNAPLVPDNNPRSVFDRVFASVMSGTPASTQQLYNEKKSILDNTLAELNALRAQVNSDERAKIDRHLDSIRQLEKQLPSLSPTSGSCQVPLRPNSFTSDKSKMPEVIRLQMEILVRAMACDLTRVGSLFVASQGSGIRYNWINSQHTRTHHDYSHQMGDDWRARLLEIDKWHADQMAYLLSLLKAVPEGSGTMLDNTLVVWSSDLAHGNNHNHRPTPFIIGGNAGGYFRTGRFLTYGQSINHTGLLVSIANAMGVNITRFGEAQYAQAALSNLR